MKKILIDYANDMCLPRCVMRGLLGPRAELEETDIMAFPLRQDNKACGSGAAWQERLSRGADRK